MAAFILRVVFLLSALLLPTANADEIARVVVWNLKWFPGGSPSAKPEDKVRQMRAAQDVLKSLNPDILLVEEVANSSAVEELISVLDDFHVAVVSEFPGRPQNVGIASRFNADSAWFEMWKKRRHSDPPRGFAFATLRLPDNRLLLTYCVHLKSNLGEAEDNQAKRIEATQQLLEHAEAMQAAYRSCSQIATLIAGDFNTSFDSEEFLSEPTLREILRKGYFWTFEGVPFEKRITIPGDGRYPDNCFDHIFTESLGKFQAKVIHTPAVSDHNPIILDFPIGSGKEN